MEHDRSLRGLVQQTIQLVTPFDQRIEFDLEFIVREAIADGLHDLIAPLLEPVPLRLPQMNRGIPFGPQTIHVFGVFPAELGTQLRVHEVDAKGFKNGLFQHVLADAKAVGTSPLVLCRRATVARGVRLGEAAPALATAKHERQEIDRTPLGPHLIGAGMRHQLLAKLHAVP